jgi:DNA repair protein RadD
MVAHDAGLPYGADMVGGVQVPLLRGYQSRVLSRLRDAYRAGQRRVLIVSPTGSGKTVMAAALIAAWTRHTPTSRVATFAHRRELVVQMASTLARFGVRAGYLGRGGDAPVQVCGSQGALASGQVPDADLVVFDECHHYASAAERWSALAKVYEGRFVVGLTATPERGDGAALDTFGALIEAATTRELVDLWVATDGAEGLVPVETLRPKAPEKPGCLAKLPIEAYLSSGLRGRKNLVFASTVAEAERFAAGFEGAGIRAHVVHGDLDATTRARRLSDFARHVDVVCNVAVLTEGTDIPAVSVVTLASRCGSYSGLVQRVGRGRRPSPGKTVCTVIDLPGVTHLLGDVDEERTFSLDGVGVRRKIASLYSYCKACGSPMPADGACTGCGRERDVRAAEISGNTLDKFAAYKREPDDARAYRLARWMREARGLGQNWRRALYRYAGVYGAMPPGRVVSLAHATLNGTEWCGQCGHSKKETKCKCKAT